MLYVMRVVALPIVCQAKRSRGLAAVLLLCAVACARTGLYPGELGDGELGADDASSGGSNASSNDAGKPNGGTPVTAPLPTSGMPTAQTGGVSPVGEPPMCVPRAEACNGRDDDCNGCRRRPASRGLPGWRLSLLRGGAVERVPAAL